MSEYCVYIVYTSLHSSPSSSFPAPPTSCQRPDLFVNGVCVCVCDYNLLSSSSVACILYVFLEKMILPALAAIACLELVMCGWSLVKDFPRPQWDLSWCCHCVLFT